MNQRTKFRVVSGDGAWVPEAKEIQNTIICWQDDMATVFWFAKSVITFDILPKRSIITGVYYANLLDQMRTAIREKCQGKLSKGVLLQQTPSQASYVF